MIYLDHAASTPCDPRVVEAMLPWFAEQHANASSPHRLGRRARAAVDRAREEVAAALGVAARRIVFTSGATEALNAAYSIAAVLTPAGKLMIVGATEHKGSLDASARVAEIEGREHLKVSPVDGIIDTSELVFDEQDVAGFMAVNNETGTVTDIPTLCRVARESGAVTVVDLTQALGKVPVDVAAWQVDLGAASAHKIGGPQGVGALVLPEQRIDEWTPLIVGGPQEKGLRAGTMNLPGIIGFGTAARLAASEREERNRSVEVAVSVFMDELMGRVPDADLNGVQAVPHIASVWLPGVDNSIVLARCPEIALATGSACNSAVPEPSHVLLALGYPIERARESVRASFSYTTTAEEAHQAASAIAKAVLDVRGLEAR